MDTTLIAAFIGALFSLGGVWFGWFLGARHSQKQKDETKQALAGALLMETLSNAWHILNTIEFLRRYIDEETIPSVNAVEVFLPPQPRIYNSAGHHVADLGPSSAHRLVEFHTDLDRALARIRRLAALDGRKLKKDDRLLALKHAFDDWISVAKSCSSCMGTLLPSVRSILRADEIDDVVFYKEELIKVREHRWKLPIDPVFDLPDKPVA